MAAENGAKKKAASSSRRARKPSPRKASESRGVRLTPSLEQELVAEGEAILANDEKIDKAVRSWLKGEDKRPARSIEVETPPW